jgi:hypothetical protein
MKSQKLCGILGFIIVGILCISTPVIGKGGYVTATGRVFCSVGGTSYPVEFTKVSLKDDDTVGSTSTNGLGYFTVSGTADGLFSSPKLYIEVEYKYSGEYGQMDVQRELFGTNRREYTSTKSYSSRIDFGNITFSSDHCRAYVMAYQAMKDYIMRTGKPLPYDRLKVVTRAPIHGGTPYSTTDKIRIPSGYNFNLETAQHELAHTVRHTLVSHYRQLYTLLIGYVSLCVGATL